MSGGMLSTVAVVRGSPGLQAFVLPDTLTRSDAVKRSDALVKVINVWEAGANITFYNGKKTLISVPYGEASSYEQGRFESGDTTITFFNSSEAPVAQYRAILRDGASYMVILHPSPTGEPQVLLQQRQRTRRKERRRKRERRKKEEIKK